MEVLQDFTKTVSEIVRSDYRTADVFKKYGINYCCGGKIPLADACAAQNINGEALVEDLTKATRTISLPNSLQYDQWRIDFLVDYIINIHHEYIRQTVPMLEATLLSFVGSHQKQFPELVRVQEVFQQLCQEIAAQTRQEEEVVFPYINQLANAYNRRESYGGLFVKTLRKPLTSLGTEHHKIIPLLGQLRALTHHYVFPENACTNHRVVFHKLRELDNDLVQHKHLENNILFPRAMALERELLNM